MRHGLKCQVPGTLHRPFIVLLEQQCADETDDGFVVGTDPNDLGASLDFPIETFDGFVTGIRALVLMPCCSL